MLLDRHFDFVRTATRASMAGSPTSRLEHVERDLDGAGQDLETVIEQLAGDGQRREDLQHGVVAAHAFNDEAIGDVWWLTTSASPPLGSIRPRSTPQNHALAANVYAFVEAQDLGWQAFVDEGRVRRRGSLQPLVVEHPQSLWQRRTLAGSHGTFRCALLGRPAP